MAQTSSLLTSPLSRTARVLGIPLAAVLLTTLFILIGFPYHHLTGRATAFASRALGVDITAADSGLSPGLDGPGFRFGTIRVETPNGDVYRVERARFGPAWSLSWITLTPTYFFEVESAIGSTEGRIRLGDELAWRGSVRDADLEELRFLARWMPIKLTGELGGEGDIETTETGFAGPLQFQAQEGALGHEALPLDIPFETLDGDLLFGGSDDAGKSRLVAIQNFALEGSMLHLKASGSVGHAENAMEAPLDIQLDLSNVQPRIRQLIEPFGVRIDAQGKSSVRVSGTLTQPSFR